MAARDPVHVYLQRTVYSVLKTGSSQACPMRVWQAEPMSVPSLQSVLHGLRSVLCGLKRLINCGRA